MNDDRDYAVEQKPPVWLVGVAIGGLVLSLGALGWSLGLQNHLTQAEKNLDAANKQNASLAAQLEDTNERLKAQGQALGQSVGMTQKELEERAAKLVAAQRADAAAAAATAAKLTKEQEATNQKVGAVQSDVATVKTDVNGVKTDVASTQADLQSTKSDLTRVMGDQGVMSGLIATNHDELEELKRRGERTYYEFTLQKGAPAQNVGTIKVQLKKVDVKRSKYTIMLSSDDKNIERKDKNLDEPVQFYSGKQPLLFELVVNNIGKNTVTGYLSTPKEAPAPIAVQ